MSFYTKGFIPPSGFSNIARSNEKGEGMIINTTYEEMARTLVKFLLHEKSSVVVSKAMGYKFNILARWVKGTRIIKWEEFLLFSKTIGLNVPQVLATSTGLIYNSIEEQKMFFTHLRAQWGHLSTKQIAQILSTDVSVINKYINGTRSPALATILKILSLREGYLEGFLISCSGDRKNPWHETTSEYVNKVHTLMENPAISTVWSCLALEEYQKLKTHSSEFISEKTKLPVSEVDRYLKILLTQQRAYFNKSKYHINTASLNILGVPNDQIKQLLAYWHQKTQIMMQGPPGERLRKGNYPVANSLRIFPASEKALNKIYQILKNCDSDILNVLEKENDPPYVDIRVYLGSFFSTIDLKADEK